MFKPAGPEPPEIKKHKSVLKKIQKKTKKVLLGQQKHATTIVDSAADGAFLDKGAVSVVLCVSDKDAEVKRFAQAIRQKLRNHKISAQVLSVSGDAVKIAMEDQLSISRCMLFCPIVDSMWFRSKLCSDYYGFSRKCSKSNGMGILPLLVLSSQLAVNDPGVQSLMKQHECLYAKLHEVTDKDLDILISNIVRHLNQTRTRMEDQVSKASPRSKPVPPPKTASEKAARKEAAAAASVASAGAKMSVSLLLTMTEQDLSLFGLMGSPGTQPGSQLRYSSILDLLNIYETHRFHVEKATQVLHTLAPLLRSNEVDKHVFQSSGWLPLLFHTHVNSPSQSMALALKNIALACTTELPDVSDANKTKMEVLVTCVKVLQQAQNARQNTTTATLLQVGVCAGAVRHLAWNSKDVKAYATRARLAMLLSNHLPDSNQPFPRLSPLECSALATVNLALATLVLESSNRELFQQCGGVERVVATIMNCTDDFVVGAACACLASFTQPVDGNEGGDLVSAINSGIVSEIITRLVSFLQTPAKSVYATQLLQNIIRKTKQIGGLAVEKGLIPNCSKILRYCLQTTPLAYGSAVLCRKVCGCLHQSIVCISGKGNVQFAWTTEVIQLLVQLLDHSQFRNDITMDIQEITCRTLISLAHNNVPIILKIGEEGGIVKLLAAIATEVSCAKEQGPDGVIKGHSESVVLNMLSLLTVLCISPENKTRVAKTNGIDVCLSLLLPNQSPVFLEKVLDTLESASFMDDKGQFVGWSKQNILTLSAFAGRSQDSNAPTVQASNLPQNLQDKATNLVDTVEEPPRVVQAVDAEPYEIPQQQQQQQVTPQDGAKPRPFSLPLRRSKVGADLIVEAQQMQSSPASAPSVVPVLSPVSTPQQSIQNGHVAPQPPARTFAPITLTHQPKTNMNKDIDTGIRRINKLVAELFQVGHAAAQQTGNGGEIVVPPRLPSPAPFPTSPTPDVQLDAELQAQLEREISGLRKEVLDEEAAMSEAQSRLIQCDEAVDYCQEEIAATDLSLLLMEHEDQQVGDDHAPGGDIGMDVADFGRDSDEDEDLDVDNIHDLRNTLMAELDAKEADRAQAEEELQVIEQRLQAARDALANKQRLLNHANGPQQHSHSSASSSRNLQSPSPLSAAPKRGVGSVCDQLEHLKDTITSELNALHNLMLSSQPGPAWSGNPESRDADIAALVAQHQREKRALLQRIEDAEDRAEAFSTKIVDEHRSIKQMRLANTMQQNLRLSQSLEVALSHETSALRRCFARWHNTIEEGRLENIAQELTSRERFVTRTLIQKEKEVDSLSRAVRTKRLAHVFGALADQDSFAVRSFFTAWRVDVAQGKVDHERHKLGGAHVRILESSLRKWQAKQQHACFVRWLDVVKQEKRKQETMSSAAVGRLAALLVHVMSTGPKTTAFARWRLHCIVQREAEIQNQMYRLTTEAYERESALTAAQRTAEEKARRLQEEKQMSLLQAERMKQDIYKQQQAKLESCLTHSENRALLISLNRWRKWTRAQLLKEFGNLQKSIQMFDGEE